MNLREEIEKQIYDNGNTVAYPDVEIDIHEVSGNLTKLFEKWALELISTHTEHEGGYCDTGEDMEWACRSDCVELAEKRIKEACK